ncbi:helix-turn-helix transcriptional regulator [Lacibacter sp.]|uniref:helix-turn-helix domain-containing protein n=1 Tax=Lacibacter sp. TaxID=1915409 RepID=UPI002B4ACC94|nr:helix-turn-helix transcriptional regulator [Lacibacter sp.]HLP39492.1 helix-turn-helix transcriptional regulator [Lacibacter sp.]
MNNTLKLTGEQLRFLRTLKRVKQPVLASKLGVKQQAVSKMENKDCITCDKVQQYLQALGLQMEEALKLLELMPSGN